MSMGSALTDLREAATDLGQAVTELVIVVHEDRPAASEIAVVDHLAEVVSELQAGTVLVLQRLAAVTEARQLAGLLGPVDEAMAACAETYWRELRAHAPVHELRRTAASRGLEWRAWQHSLELSLLRCEGPLQRAVRAVQAAWHEVGDLLSHYLPPSGERSLLAVPQSPDEQAQMSTRRSS